jgi:hypothetical protein
MAKRQKLLPAHRREAVDDSALIRSAEALGRMIGSLQRQLDGGEKRFSGPVDHPTNGKSKRASASARSNSTRSRRSLGESESKPAGAKTRAKKTTRRSSAARTRR